ncbi:MAG: type II toxin-antitoxin system VapC family toxin [Oligoflexia bacterium]|nr:type II toxin-antitoxin system VapC family toxin [Oligoflexia bacterium]
MNFLLDTHALLWISNNSKELSKRLKKDFKNRENDFFISIASLWEMTIKISLKKLELPCSLEKYVKTEVVQNGIKILPISLKHLALLEELPFHHRDPFDRLIITQAITEDLTIYSKDKIFSRYDVALKWRT